MKMVCATKVVTSLIPQANTHTFLQSYVMRSQHRKAKTQIDYGLYIFSYTYLNQFAIEANSNSHFRFIFRNQRHGHQFEQHLELKLLLLV